VKVDTDLFSDSQINFNANSILWCVRYNASARRPWANDIRTGAASYNPSQYGGG